VATKPNKTRRFIDSVRDKSILVPYLEQELLRRGEGVWPDEYAIKIYNKERVHDGYFHPSSDATAPERLLYYLFSQQIKRDPPTVEQIMTFQVGSAYHALVQSMLIHLGFIDLQDVEVSFASEQRHCSGTLDVGPVKLPNGIRAPIEIKSAGYGGNISPQFMEKYIAQIQLYMDLGCGDMPAEYGLLLILEKTAPHRFREILIRRDEQLLNSIYTRWSHVLEALDFGDPSMLQWPCHEWGSKAHNECPAKGLCEMNGAGR
jgi:hypothetical protein